ncbi:MAG: hypothetical protein PWQ64_753 [Desulfomicrobiaceae bacterium]|nr:hypothetical protein [Desulfomicrobiaceae bacterium]
MSESYYETIVVARQPIFTAEQRVWGYELLFRSKTDLSQAVITDADQATLQVIADGFAVATENVPAEARVLINFPRNLLLGEAPYVLPADRSIVEILETVTLEPEVLAACARLKEAGYTLALDDFVGQSGFEPLCALADIVKVDLLTQTPESVMAIVKSLRRYNITLLAEKVETREMFEVCKRLGFVYFQGYFFRKPEIVEGRKLTASQASRIRLLHELSHGADLEQLVRILEADVSLSYRLLRYINSVRFALVKKVESIQRAASMLGRKNLQQWLQVTLLADMNAAPRAQELVRLSVIRARFFQILAEAGQAPLGPDAMFLLGFFSLLDGILDQPMEVVLAELPLDPAVQAILVDPASPHAPWLLLAQELDRCHWPGVRAQTEVLGLPLAQVGAAYHEAMVWTDAMLGAGE